MQADLKWPEYPHFGSKSGGDQALLQPPAPGFLLLIMVAAIVLRKAILTGDEGS